MDLKELFEALSDKEKETKSRMKGVDEAFAVAMREGEAKQMHEMSVRWTLMDLLPYGLQLMGTDADPEKRVMFGRMLREMTDFLIENMNIKDAHKLPNAGWFKRLVHLKAADDE